MTTSANPLQKTPRTLAAALATVFGKSRISAYGFAREMVLQGVAAPRKAGRPSARTIALTDEQAVHLILALAIGTPAKEAVGAARRAYWLPFASAHQSLYLVPDVKEWPIAVAPGVESISFGQALVSLIQIYRSGLDSIVFAPDAQMHPYGVRFGVLEGNPFGSVESRAPRLNEQQQLPVQVCRWWRFAVPFEVTEWSAIERSAFIPASLFKAVADVLGPLPADAFDGQLARVKEELAAQRDGVPATASAPRAADVMGVTLH